MELSKVFIILNTFFVSNSCGNVIIDAKDYPKPNCTCVPYYQCSYDSGDLITAGEGLLDLRIENSPCRGYFDVCCNISQEALVPTIEPPQKNNGCGYQNSGFFSWYAPLLYQEKKDISYRYRCAVSLIHSSVILTAAHCFNRDGNWIVHIGNVTRHISKIIVHPEYNNDTMYNDIALGVLNEPVLISEKVNPICIPPLGINLDNTQCRTVSRIIGPNDGGSYLKMLQVAVVPKNKCIDMLRSTRLGPFFQLHHSFLCAGKENDRNTCTGDGGSPLVCPVPGQPARYHQAGIVSWGIGCGEENVPDVYIKVPAFRNWIDAEMKKNGFDITSYRY